MFRYFVVSTAVNYDNAITNCNNFGGILASVTDENEYNEAKFMCQRYSLSNHNGCWIGLHKRHNIWSHIDGDDVKNSFAFDSHRNPNYGVYPWSVDQPNNDAQECIHLKRSINYEWNDKSCNSEMISLCDKNPPKSCGININSLKVWYKGGLNDITNNGYNAINVTGNIYNDVNDCGIYGDINSSFIIPYNINTTSYTIIYVGKYNGNNKERILTSTNKTNYYAGFGNGKSSGMCYQGGNITHSIDKSNNNWLISTSYPGGCHVNGTNISNNIDPWLNEFDPGTFHIGVNIYDTHNIKEHSDWKIYEILIFDVILSGYQIECIENYLSQEHTIPIPSYSIIPTINPTKTCPQTIDYSSHSHTQKPTNNPSIMPTLYPSHAPNKGPTNQPSYAPSKTPTNNPSHNPSQNPSYNPSIFPTEQPTNNPSNVQSLKPSNSPSVSPTKSPTNITPETLFNSDKPTGLDSTKFILLGSSLIVCCVCCAFCCFIIVFIYKKHNSHIKMMLNSQSMDTNKTHQSSNHNKSLPPVILDPTSGNINEYSQNDDSEGHVPMDGDTITNYGDV